MESEKEITLEKHLHDAGIDSELSKLMLSFAYLSLDAQHHFPKYLRGVQSDRNKYGEVVAKLDDWVNGFTCDRLIKTGLVRKIYSEELKEPFVATSNSNAPFVVTLDPLDGSSNIITNNPFGAIVGVYREDLPQTGRKLVASFYKLYGPVNTFVYCAGKGSHEFVKHYDAEGKAKFLLLHENIRLPAKGEVFGIGGNPLEWDPKFLKFAKDLFRNENMRVRYCGAFVGDFAQVLHRGGFFAYPGTTKSAKGKLRLVYEAIPMANIIESAGGASWNGSAGNASLLDVQDADIDARVPLYMGNKDLIDKLKQYLA